MCRRYSQRIWNILPPLSSLRVSFRTASSLSVVCCVLSKSMLISPSSLWTSYVSFSFSVAWQNCLRYPLVFQSGFYNSGILLHDILRFHNFSICFIFPATLLLQFHFCNFNFFLNRYSPYIGSVCKCRYCYIFIKLCLSLCYSMFFILCCTSDVFTLQLCYSLPLFYFSHASVPSQLLPSSSLLRFNNYISQCTYCSLQFTFCTCHHHLIVHEYDCI